MDFPGRVAVPQETAGYDGDGIALGGDAGQRWDVCVDVVCKRFVPNLGGLVDLVSLRMRATG